MKREDTIGFRVRDLSLTIRRAAPCSGECGEFTRVQGWVIGYLCDHRGTDVYQRDIEKQMSVSRPTMTAILQRMEKNGLIERVRDERDSRLKRLIPTDAALEMRERHLREIEEYENSLREGLSDGELADFFAVMEKIKNNAARAADGREGGKSE